MSLNNTPSSERIHIGIFGKRNAGKSSIINALTGQSLAIVSDVKGTTTDPVLKAMELLPLGPVVMIDTPGLDDEGELGKLRIQKAYQILNKTDIAVLVVDGSTGMTKEDAAILERIQQKEIPYLIVLNKADLVSEDDKYTAIEAAQAAYKIEKQRILWVSATDQTNIYELKEQIAALAPQEDSKLRIVGDLIHPSDFVVLVVPIDKAAPKGRLILPQQQTIRDILEADATAIVVKEHELRETLQNLSKKPSLVITDSQVFAKVSADTPREIPLTSFSILFARYKGNLHTVVHGARALDTLENGDTVLISEGCTHHRQCDDIGTVKLPRWIRNYTGKQLNFEFTSGTEFPLELDRYKMVVHCGGCTLNEREMKYRLKCAEDANIPITNYGTAIAYMQGILERSIEIFPSLG
ncbi:MAG: [FeFe] hydrogenase H-cluster maturation GTPase HydF [Dorea sp.]